jgi:hypothetical protein
MDNADSFLEGNQPQHPVSNYGDDELFSGNYITGNNSIEQKKTIGDIVYHLNPLDLFKDHFMDVVNADSNKTKCNVFMIGYNCDKGVRSSGGRSGSEKGPESLRKMLYSYEGSTLKDNNISLFDLGDFDSYLLPENGVAEKQLL